MSVSFTSNVPTAGRLQPLCAAHYGGRLRAATARFNSNTSGNASALSSACCQQRRNSWQYRRPAGSSSGSIDWRFVDAIGRHAAARRCRPTPTRRLLPLAATVYPDTAINALVISAPTPVYNNLRIGDRGSSTYGGRCSSRRGAEVRWIALPSSVFSGGPRGGINRSGTQGFGGTNFSSTNGATTANILGVAANPAAVAQGFNVAWCVARDHRRQRILNLGLLARALQSDVQANILSMPTCWRSTMKRHVSRAARRYRY